MARNKNYDRNQVVKSALSVFWLYGYSATSIAQLCDVSGLNKRSLYNEFGSKAELFDEVLKLYKQMMGEPVKYLTAIPTCAENVLSFFRFVAEHNFDKYDGCLLTLALNESHQLDDNVVDGLDRHFTQLEQGLFVNLLADMPNEDARILAKYLVNSLLGLTSWIRLKPTKEEFAQVIETILVPVQLKLIHK